MLQITLNTDIQPVFFLPGKLHLTFENAGPVELDQSKLSNQELLWIKNARLKGVLKVTGLEDTLTNSIKKEVITDTQADKPTPEEMTERLLIKKRHTLESIQKTLKAPMPALLRFIEKSTDIALLRILVTEETSGKNRDKVLEATQERIGQLNRMLSESMGPPLDEKDIAKEKNLPDIEEEEQETVTINLGS